MVEFKKLEELRTRREVEEYFKQLGKNITDEELTALKQNYDKAQETNVALTMQQLNDVAGGGKCYFATKEKGQIKLLNIFPDQTLIGLPYGRVAFIVDSKCLPKYIVGSEGANVEIRHDLIRSFRLCELGKTDKGGTSFRMEAVGKTYYGMTRSKAPFNGDVQDGSFIVLAEEPPFPCTMSGVPMVNNGKFFIFENDEIADKAWHYIEELVGKADDLTHGETTVDFKDLTVAEFFETFAK